MKFFKLLPVLLSIFLSLKGWAINEETAVITDPLESIKMSIDALDSAQKEVWFTTHMFFEDRVGLAAVAKFIEIAKRGVQVNLVLDDWNNRIHPEILGYMQSFGIKIYRYSSVGYRPRSGPQGLIKTALNLWRPFKVNQRMHDKIMAVDGKILIVTDRNLTESFFRIFDKNRFENPAKAFSFVSRDIFVKGDVAEDVATKMKELVANDPLIDLLPAIPFVRAKMDQLLADIQDRFPRRYVELGSNWKQNLVYADEVQFYGDEPNQKKGADTGTFGALVQLIASAKKRLVVESPYNVFPEELREAFRTAHRNGAQITYISSGASALDAAGSALWALWQKEREFLASLGATIYEKKGPPEMLDPSATPRKGLTAPDAEPPAYTSHHSKVVIADDRVSLGSANLDNRSLIVNRESGVIARSHSLANNLFVRIMKDVEVEGYWKTVRNGSILRREDIIAQKTVAQAAEASFDRSNKDVVDSYESAVRNNFSQRPILRITDTWDDRPGGVLTFLRETEKAAAEMGIRYVTVHPGMVSSYRLKSPIFQNASISYLSHKYLEELIQRVRPSAVEIVTGGALGTSAIEFFRKNNIPFTVDYHTDIPGFAQDRFMVPQVISRFFVRQSMKRTPGVRTFSPVSTQSLVDMGVPAEKIREGTMGVDTDLYRPRTVEEVAAVDPQTAEFFKNLPRPISLLVSRISTEKNVEAFINAKIPGSKVIVGDGPLMAEFNQRKARGELPNTFFVGFKKGTELAHYYSLADVFVFTSVRDTFGLVMAEALASGTPVAAVSSPAAEHLVIRPEGQPRVGAMNADVATAVEEALTVSRTEVRNYAQNLTWKTALIQSLAQLTPLSEDHYVPASTRAGRCANTFAAGLLNALGAHKGL